MHQWKGRRIMSFCRGFSCRARRWEIGKYKESDRWNGGKKILKWEKRFPSAVSQGTRHGKLDGPLRSMPLIKIFRGWGGKGVGTDGDVWVIAVKRAARNFFGLTQRSPDRKKNRKKSFVRKKENRFQKNKLKKDRRLAGRDVKAERQLSQSINTKGGDAISICAGP